MSVDAKMKIQSCYFWLSACLYAPIFSPTSQVCSLDLFGPDAAAEDATAHVSSTDLQALVSCTRRAACDSELRKCGVCTACADRKGYAEADCYAQKKHNASSLFIELW